MAKQNKAVPEATAPDRYRPTAAELELRIEKVTELIISGFSRANIMKYVAEKTDWNIRERMIDNYIASAREAITTSSAIDRNYEIGKANARFNSLYHAAIKVMDFGRAIAAERARCELLGLNAPKELRILEGVNERQLAELVQALNRSNIPASVIFDELIQQLSEAGANAGSE